MRLVDDLHFIIDRALKEDYASHDITTKSLSLSNVKVSVVIYTKEAGVCAGINVAKEVFRSVDKRVRFTAAIKDGNRFDKGDEVARISGSARSILAVERTALNFLGRLSGIATLTRAFVDEVKSYRVKILDTRKTTPCLRFLEKYAVRMGGGYNHRFDLSDGVLIKDNHIACLKKKARKINWGSIIKKIRRKTKSKLLEIEVTSTKEFKDVIRYAPDIIMLDNMDKDQIKECVRIRNSVNKKIQLEISGNVNLGNIKSLAQLGVNRISIGSLTHSPKAIDLSLAFLP